MGYNGLFWVKVGFDIPLNLLIIFFFKEKGKGRG